MRSRGKIKGSEGWQAFTRRIVCLSTTKTRQIKMPCSRNCSRSWTPMLIIIKNMSLSQRWRHSTLIGKFNMTRKRTKSNGRRHSNQWLRGKLGSCSPSACPGQKLDFLRRCSNFYCSSFSPPLSTSLTCFFLFAIAPTPKRKMKSKRSSMWSVMEAKTRAIVKTSILLISSTTMVSMQLSRIKKCESFYCLI